MTRLMIAAAALAVLAGAPGLADTAPAPLPPPTDAEPKKVCKTFAEAGSRVRSKKTCRTPAEWADLRQQTRIKIEEMQRVGDYRPN